jgi:sugar-specific transcriptional regulator TrmB
VNEKALENILVAFGITEKELEVYIFLTKHGALKGGEIARHLKKDKAQIFRILKSLQVKGLVESTLETPTRFMPVQLETVLDLIIKTKRDEADLIDTEREELISLWKNLSKTTLTPSERFLVIEGSKQQNLFQDSSDGKRR